MNPSNQSNSPVPIHQEAPWERANWFMKLWWRLKFYREWILLPLLLVVIVYLWEQVQSATSTPAHALKKTYTVGSPMQGTLSSLQVLQHQKVKKGQIIGKLDTRILDLAIAAAEQKQKRLQSNIQRTTQLYQTSRIEMLLKLSANLTSAHKALLSSKTKARAWKAEKAILQKEIRWLQRLRRKQLGRSTRMGNLRAKSTVLNHQLRSATKVIRLLRRQKRISQKLYLEYQKNRKQSAKNGLDVLIKPLELQLKEHQIQLKTLKLQRESLSLRSPVNGVIQNIYKRTGDRLRVGDNILTIVQEHSKHVVAYIKESSARAVPIGTVVRLHTQAPSVRPFSHLFQKTTYIKAKVIALGDIAPMPLRFRTIPNKPTWVRSLIIQLEKGKYLIPGENVYIQFRKSDLQSSPK